MIKQENLGKLIITIIAISFYILILALNHQQNRLVDDAFITFRYARNFAEGNGLVYNQGESVLGTTSPGYALLLSTGALLTKPEAIPTISLSINFLAILIVMLCLALIVYQLSHKSYIMALLSPLLILSSSSTLYVIVSGMEGAVFLALLFLGLTSIVYRRWLLACIAIGVMIWIRPEGVFVIGLLGLTILIMTIRKTLTWQQFFLYAFIIVLPSIVYLGMLITIYDTLLPQSIISKSAGLYPIPPFEQINVILQSLLRPIITLAQAIFGDNNPVTTDPTVFILMIPISLFLIVVGSMKLAKLDSTLWIVPLYLLICVIFYSSRSTLIFAWYHANYEIFAILLMACGFGQILNSIFKASPLKRNLHIVNGIIITLFFIPTLFAIPYQAYATMPRQEHFVSNRELGYYALLQEIGDDIPEDAIIALPEIGYLGFYLPNNTILDLAGLVSPEIVNYFPIPLEDRDNQAHNGAIPKEAILDFQPDIIITLDYFARSGLYQTDWFDDIYEIVYYLPDINSFSFEEYDLQVVIHRDYVNNVSIIPNN